MKIKLLTLLAASLLAPCFASADDAVAPAPVPIVAPSQDTFKTLVHDEKTARAELRAKETVAAAAINGDASLTADQKAVKLAELRKDYKAQARTMQQKYVAEKKAMRAQIKTDRAASRKAHDAGSGRPAHTHGDSDKGRAGGQGNAGAPHGKR